MRCRLDGRGFPETLPPLRGPGALQDKALHAHKRDTDWASCKSPALANQVHTEPRAPDEQAPAADLHA
jgi:hypothetical protein